MEGQDRLRQYEGFLLDIDGVLVRGGEPIPGAAAALGRLKKLGRIVLFTNNSTRSRRRTAEWLAEISFPVRPEEVVTSACVAARWLLENHGRAKVWTIGEEGLSEELSLAGHELVSAEEAAWIVVGMDRKLSYEKLAQALHALLRGARFLATNRDATFPTPEGLIPGAGAVVGAIEGMGFTPEVVVGKPSPIAFRIALEVASAEPEHILMIGDRLETDILGAQAVGLATALILSGVSQADDVHKLGIKPTWMASDLAALARGEISPP